MIRGIHHASFSTNDLDRLVHFYRDLIGLEEVWRLHWDAGNEPADRIIGLKDTVVDLVMLKAGNAFLEIFQYSNPKGKAGDPNRPACDSGLTHVCFDVSDVYREYDRLQKLGVKFNSPPQEFESVCRSVYGRDADGNLFELQEIVNPESRIMLPSRSTEPRAP